MNKRLQKLNNFSSSKIIRYLQKRYSNLQITDLTRLKQVDISSSNYLINTIDGDYLLKIILNDLNSTQIEKICKILKFCNKKKLRVPNPQKSKAKTFVDFKNKAFLTNFFSGKPFSGSTKQIKLAASAIADLHKVLKKVPKSYYFSRNFDSYKILNIFELKKIVNILKGNHLKLYDKKVFHNLAYITKCIRNFNKMKNCNRSIKQQIIHNDLHPNNLIFANNHVSIVDFYSMKKGNIMEDIVFSSFRLACQNTNELRKIKKNILLFLNNYSKLNSSKRIIEADYNYFLWHALLSRISYILRKKYFKNSNLWIHDFNKYLQLIKTAERLPRMKKFRMQRCDI